MVVLISQNAAMSKISKIDFILFSAVFHALFTQDEYTIINPKEKQ